ncbi:MAG: hypothetical protein JWP83_2136 [Mycobacterium sp.]|jgi:hypothetical protein|nr:hypothetical protein [Mycobacterium sp.]
MATAAPRHRDHQHGFGLRDDARLDGAGERLPRRGPANRRCHGRRRVRGQGWCGRAVPRFDTVRPGRRGAGGRRARSGGRGPAGDRGLDHQGRRLGSKCDGLRRAGARTRHAASLGGSDTDGARRGRGVEHAWQAHRRGPAGRCAHTADRRDRAQCHRAGEDAVHLPDDRGPAATGLQRAADAHLDRDHRQPPTAPGRLPERRAGGRRQRSVAPIEGGGCRDHDRGFPAVDRGGAYRRLPVGRSSSVASTSPRSTAESWGSIGATRWASSSRRSIWSPASPPWRT